MKLYKLAVLLLVGMLVTPAVFAQLSAGFTATPTTGCAPLLVHFTNTTTPSGGTTYSWTFGTTGSSTLTNPSASFTTPGTHLVTLTATNGSETSTFTMSIVVIPSPVVSFTASDTTVCPGEPVIFTSTSTGGAPGALTYTWGFGDGSTGTGSPVSHAYLGPGNYTVTLHVRNSATSCESSLVRPAYVEVVSRPTAGIAPIVGGCNPPVSVSFASTSVGVPVLTYAWSFGDGTTGAGAAPTHSYGTTGTFPVRLIVTDGNGCVDSVASSVTIADIAASFTLPSTACVSSLVSFTNTSTPHTSRTWSYGDGGTSTGVHGSHAYATPGTYTVTLTITSGPCTHTVSHTITILPAPAATLTISPLEPCPAPVTVTYTGSAAAGVTFSWLFEGGVTGSGNPASHTYGTNGVKNVGMIVTDPVTGCKDTIYHTHNIYDIDFDAAVTPDEGCVPLTVTFSSSLVTHVPSGTSPYPYGVSSYSWDFGDGSATGSGSAPSHTYTASGIYHATVTATTTNGCEDTAIVEIRVGDPPEVTFTADPRRVCYSSHTPIIFTPVIISGPVDEWEWEFGDTDGTIYDTTAPPATVAHTYTVPGTFTVSVTPRFRGCPGPTFTIEDYIIIDSPKAIIKDSIFCTPSTRVKFWDESMGDDTHLWIFGDGTTSTVDDPIHDYPGPGTYTVLLTTHNIASDCRDTTSVSIFIETLIPDFITDDALVCKGESVIFASTTTGGTPSGYAWYIDGGGLAGTSSTLTRSFTDTGWHTITLVVRNSHGCFDTVTKEDYILVSGPSVDFSGTPLSGCSPLSVTFTDASTATSGSTLTTYLWRFGDGTTGTGTPVSHTYVPGGTYTVRCIVTDNVGCRDSLTRPLYVRVFNPIASFSVSNRNPCLNSSVTFTLTTPSVSTATWDFGDGTSSSVLSPVHTYTATGMYNVRLTVVDVNGCTHDTTYTSYVNVNKPVADFTMSDSVSVCPPLTVNFTNTSTGATTYGWSLGDGSTSTATSPSNLYLASGLYPIRLIATNTFGCRDTMNKAVNIFGYAGAFSYTPLEGCAPLTVHFTATLSNIPHITWDFSDGVTSATSFSDTITHVYTTPGAYVPKLLLSDNTGCQTSSIGTDTIKVDGINPKFTTMPSPVCIGVEFSMIDSSTTYWSPIDSWDWTYDGNTSTDESPTHTINTPGTYPITLRVTNAWGCTGVVTKDIVIDPPPVVTADADTVVCVGDPATLHGYGAVSYVWSPPPTLSCTACNPTNATPSVETTYTVVGTDHNGCIDSATVTVGLRTHTTSRAWGDTAVCYGVKVQLFDTGGHFYEWIPAAGLSSNTIYNPIASPDYTTVYTVIATLGSCIPDTNTVLVTVYPLPTVDAGPNQRLLAGSKAQLNATGTNIASYEWWPPETLDCPECPNPVASMSVRTTYNVDVLSQYGCRASDSVTVLLYCDNSQIFIPNTFTPNGDGQNDVFYPRGIGVKTIKTFRIYNRWGELLFERTNINLNDAENAWDGSYKGGGARPGVYVYIMEALCYTGEDIVMKGDVTIIR